VKAWLPCALLVAFLCTIAVALTAGGMASVSAWLWLLVLGPLLGVAALLGVIGRSLWQRSVTRPLAATGLVAALLLIPVAWQTGVWPMAFPSRAAGEQALSIRVPTNQKMRVVWGGDDPAANQHALMPDQRWAYDLVVEPTNLASEDMSDWGCFGVPVVAPVSGRVTRVENDQPDAKPATSTQNMTAPLGNHVVIEPEQGGFLLIAHLQQGSVLATPQQQVVEGEVIGACGNSGNTSGAHVHIHYQRQDPARYPVNFAEGLPLEFRDHRGSSMPPRGIELDGDVVRMTGEEIVHRRAEPG
jgi:hypothetical protein